MLATDADCTATIESSTGLHHCTVFGHQKEFCSHSDIMSRNMNISIHHCFFHVRDLAQMSVNIFPLDLWWQLNMCNA